jgi:lysophospholipase L1-like esterase
LILEAGTRLIGNQPGLIENFRGFQLVDNLETYNLYKLDEFGIYSINVALFDSLKTINKEDYPSFIYQENVVQVIDDFEALKSSMNADSSSLAKAVLSSKDSSFNHLLIHYINSPINKEGFKSIPFELQNTERTKVLLLGDSFAYGLSASPCYFSFADELLAKGYIIYNTGINGTDPAQYSAVLEKYLLKLQPDVVILNFSSASDFMTFPREAKAQQPHEHQTNAGFIESAPLGSYMNVKESYKFYKNFISVPENSSLYAICKKSTAASFLFTGLIDLGLAHHSEQEEYYRAKDTITAANMVSNTKVHIDKMNQLAIDNNIPLLNIIIPVAPESRFSDKNYNDYFVDETSLNTVFSNFNYTYPKNLTREDYKKEGAHFNNAGSKKYAKFLEDLIETTLKNYN